jgi:hypothetical protein
VIGRLGAVTFDCSAPEELAAFWAAVLGAETVRMSDRCTAVRTGWGLIACLQVDGYRPSSWPDGDVPKQAHLDVAVEDLDEAERDVLALGATAPGWQPAPTWRRILIDPAGHPFCLIRPQP